MTSLAGSDNSVFRMGSIITPGQANIRNDDALVYKEVDTPEGKRLERVKTSEYNLKYRPWQVTLVIYPEEHPIKMFHTFYYVRCGNPQDAVASAETFFQKWERKRFAPGCMWPDTNGPARAECIDEQDWFKALKEAQKSKVFLYFDNKINPQVFAYYPGGWPKYWTKRLH